MKHVTIYYAVRSPGVQKMLGISWLGMLMDIGEVMLMSPSSWSLIFFPKFACTADRTPFSRKLAQMQDLNCPRRTCGLVLLVGTYCKELYHGEGHYAGAGPGTAPNYGFSDRRMSVDRQAWWQRTNRYRHAWKLERVTLKSQKGWYWGKMTYGHLTSSELVWLWMKAVTRLL
jgi:hypothetical protein